MASCGVSHIVLVSSDFSEAHRIQARLRMHMGHMYIFIIIAIANAFTMRSPFLVGL